MTFDLPPIAKKAERLMLDVEQAVRLFPQYHKHAIGGDLRAQAREVVRLCNRAWRDQGRRLHWTGELVWAIDEVKVSLQIAKQLEAFKNGFTGFQILILAAEEVGRLAGGWKRQQEHLKGQNPPSRAMRGARQDTGHSRRPVCTGANA